MIGSAACDGRQLPFASVNDGVCDCQDGMDEPATGACSNSRFYCPNTGHQGTQIAVSRVNDAVCDCCDGSDEWARSADLSVSHPPHAISLSLKRCPNTCSDFTRARIAAISARHSDVARGLEIQSAAAAAARDAVADAEAQAVILNERLRLLTEERDIHVEAEMLILAEEKRAQDAKNAAAEPSVPDAGAGDVSNATESPPAPAAAVPQEAGDPVAPGSFTQEEHNAADAIPVASLVDRVSEVLGSLSETTLRPVIAHFNRLFFPTPLQRARAAISEKDQLMAAVRRQLQDVSAITQVDWGTGLAFFNLRSKCTQHKTSAFRYEICPYGSITQTDTSDPFKSTPVSLGAYTSWEDIDVSKLPAVLADAEHLHARVMVFIGGARCWATGTERSAKVYFVCAAETTLLKLEEPDTCSYVMLVAAAAACAPSELDALERERAQLLLVLEAIASSEL